MDEEETMMQIMFQTLVSECSESSLLTEIVTGTDTTMENEMLTSHLILCEEKDAKVILT